jgi:hypothetical protein
MGLHDRSNRPIREFAHVKLVHPRTSYYGRTGTVVRIDQRRRRVWVQLGADGPTVEANCRSIQVVVPNAQRGVK